VARQPAINTVAEKMLFARWFGAAHWIHAVAKKNLPGAKP